MTKTAYEIFLEDWEEEEELPPEPYEDDVLSRERIHRAEMYLDQKELVESRLLSLEVTPEEKLAIELGAEAILAYKSTGSVTKTAMEYVEEVTTDEKRQVRLLNVVMPLARHLSKERGKGDE